MADVDPFIIKIPNFFWNHPDPEVRNYFQYLNRWAQDMWIRTGAETDNIAAQAVREIYPWDLTGSLDSQKIDHVRIVSSDVTLTGYEKLVIVEAACTVTLNPSPREAEQVAIKRTDAGSVVLSSSLNIDGESTYTMFLDYEARDLIYTTNSGWLIV